MVWVLEMSILLTLALFRKIFRAAHWYHMKVSSNIPDVWPMRFFPARTHPQILLFFISFIVRFLRVVSDFQESTLFTLQL